MPKILVKIPVMAATEYPILIQSGLLTQPERWLPIQSSGGEIVIITDHTVKKLYAQTLARSLKQLGWRVLLLAFPAGEASKNQRTKNRLETQMLRHGCGRHTLCVALGGGVAGDIGGFIAATYMRGIPLIQLPTSLLAMVDSSVGGKTAINTAYGKNLIGAFWQPQAVIADIHCLRTLPKLHLINGLIEAIKMFLTHDRKSFQYLQKHLAGCLSGDEKILQTVIKRAVTIKAAVVAADEREHLGMRMTLNFGHTIGHALEKISGYKILHGYAVAYGILVEAKIAELLGILAPADYMAIATLLAKLAIFPQELSHYSHKKIIQATKYDKKIQSGKVRYVLLKNIGQVYSKPQTFTHPISDELVTCALQVIGGDYYGGK